MSDNATMKNTTIHDMTTGSPARLIMPRMYAYKAVKWVTRIELIDQPYLGYWEYHGFETDAWVGIY